MAIERNHLHRVPVDPFTAAFGETRAVGWSSTFNHLGARYSVPHDWVDQRIWVRVEGDQVVAVATPPSGPVEIARHRQVGPGHTSIDPAHYPNRRDPLHRQPVPKTATDAAFLAIGSGATTWLVEAAAIGTRSIDTKMNEIIELARAFGRDNIDRALGQAAIACRFTIDDLLSIVAATPQQTRQASETYSLQRGTSAWRHIGNNPHTNHNDSSGNSGNGSGGSGGSVDDTDADGRNDDEERSA